MVYLNNAATSFPKPEAVREAYRKAGDSLPPGQFRSTFENSDEDVFPTCRERLGRLLGTGNKDRIFFSSGATESLNALICGLRIKADDIITTVTEHNSVLRPLYNIPQIKGRPRLVSCDETGYVDPERIEAEAGKGGAKAIILNHCSNVTGAIQDAKAIGEIAKRYGLTYILDASQSAGCIDVKADDWGVDALAFTGHKSLMGIQGTGGYYVREGISFRPLKYGGTGLDSSRITYEDEQYEYEVGTQNGVGIAVLSAAAAWVLEQGVEKIAAKEVWQILIVNDGADCLHFHGNGGDQHTGMDDEDHVFRSLIIDAHTVMDLVGVYNNGVARVQHQGLSVHGIGHLPGLHGYDLDILMEMRNTFPGHAGLDPPVINIGRERRIVIVDDLRSVVSFYDESHYITIHDPLLKSFVGISRVSARFSFFTFFHFPFIFRVIITIFQNRRRLL